MAITSRNPFGAFGFAVLTPAQRASLEAAGGVAATAAAPTYWSSASLNSRGSVLTLQTPGGPEEVEVPPRGSTASYGFGPHGEALVTNPGANNEIFVDGRSISPGGSIKSETAGYVQDSTFVANKGRPATAEELGDVPWAEGSSGSGGVLKVLAGIAGVGALAFAANKKFGKK